MANKLTRKQAKFVDGYIKTGNGRKSALDSYDTDNPKTADKIANTNLNNNKIQTVIAKALEKHEITEETIAEEIAGGLKAQKVAFNFITKEFEQLPYPDWNIKHKYLTALIEILGVKAPDKHEVKFAGVLGFDTLANIRERLGINQD